jgi:hypothetical protein
MLMNTMLIGLALGVIVLVVVGIWLCLSDMRVDLHRIARDLDERLMRWRR